MYVGYRGSHKKAEMPNVWATEKFHGKVVEQGLVWWQSLFRGPENDEMLIGGVSFLLKEQSVILPAWYSKRMFYSTESVLKLFLFVFPGFHVYSFFFSVNWFFDSQEEIHNFSLFTNGQFANLKKPICSKTFFEKKYSKVSLSSHVSRLQKLQAIHRT